VVESLAGADTVLDAGLKAQLDRITNHYRGASAI